jgi:hypothetical protein
MLPLLHSYWWLNIKNLYSLNPSLTLRIDEKTLICSPALANFKNGGIRQYSQSSHLGNTGLPFLGTTKNQKGLVVLASPF